MPASGKFAVLPVVPQVPNVSPTGGLACSGIASGSAAIASARAGAFAGRAPTWSPR
jgi:hypothetical protein